MTPQTILIVDDDPVFRLAVTDLLQAYGYQILSACDGLSAVQLCSGNSINLIIVDMYMPHMNGMELVLLLHKKFPDIPIFTITGGPLSDSDLFIIKKTSERRVYFKPMELHQMILDVDSMLKNQQKQK